jgi:hypothetical protein
VLVGLGHLSKTITDLFAPLAATDSSLRQTILILVLVIMATVAMIYGRTKPFFICSRQTVRAALGTAILVILLYSAFWSLLQIVRKTQNFVLFSPQLWSLQSTLNNLKDGGILVLFAAAVSLLGSPVAVEPEYKFTTFSNEWKRWKAAVEKLAQKEPLGKQEHESLLDATEKMIKELQTRAGHVQPIANQSAEQLKGPLEHFQSWYQRKTEVSFKACDRLDNDVEADVNAILRLC